MVNKIDRKLDALNAKMNTLESTLLRLDDVERTMARMSTTMDGWSAELGVLSAGHLTLEERCSRLEGVPAQGCSPMTTR